jgi:hypothetical chaperone protein
MYIGLDYGTSHCAVTASTTDGLVSVPLEDKQAFLTSCLYTPERCLISDFVAQTLVGDQQKFMHLRQATLRQAPETKQNLGIKHSREALLFGAEALSQHMSAPTEGYFIKSPKSFLGASGLRDEMVAFFEDVVTAMLLEIKQRAEQFLQTTISGAVIGRPVNFQGINAEASNRQAQSILLASAHRAGLQQVEFLYEPLAAGFDFERKLTDNKTVLVVDIGGGTSDCSMVRMGPAHRDNVDRSRDFLAHTGERIGGNDFDIRLALEALMPFYGLNSPLKNNLPMPVMPFAQATSINDVAAQSAFYSEKMRITLEQLHRDTTEPTLFERFIHLRENKQNFSLVRKAELAKIALSHDFSTVVDLTTYTSGLNVEVTQLQFSSATAMLLERIKNLAQEAINQAQIKPDLVYLTGGSAKSLLVKQALNETLGTTIPLVEGDHFGSVVAGLGVWAQKISKGQSQ